MSFILDALRKSETERQHQGTAEFANVPTSEDRRRGPPAWLWVLGVLLFVNLAVLTGILLRPDVSAPRETADTSLPVTTPAEARAEIEPREDFANRVAAARENAPPVEEPAPTPAADTRSMDTADTEPPLASLSPPVSRSPAVLRTIHEARAQGLVSLPDLHVDIHVFSESAPDRFVFINMVKYNEGARLSEGPLVEEITPDGVVLSMNGTTFLLPRD